MKKKGPDYLYEDLPNRLPVCFKLMAQIAEEGDVVDDATVRWPEERHLVELGKVRIESVVSAEENEREQKNIIFDPVPRVEVIEVSGDPLLEMRAAVYLVSGRERRAA